MAVTDSVISSEQEEYDLVLKLEMKLIQHRKAAKKLTEAVVRYNASQCEIDSLVKDHIELCFEDSYRSSGLSEDILKFSYCDDRKKNAVLKDILLKFKTLYEANIASAKAQLDEVMRELESEN